MFNLQQLLCKHSKSRFTNLERPFRGNYKDMRFVKRCVRCSRELLATREESEDLRRQWTPDWKGPTR